MVPNPRRRLKALLVEDSLRMQEILTESLESMPGLEVAGVAGTALQAIAVFEVHRPDFVILDLALGIDSGLDVLREIKQRTPACVVLIFTGHDQASYRQHCLGAGADFFFSKHGQYEDLIQQLHRLTTEPNAAV